MTADASSPSPGPSEHQPLGLRVRSDRSPDTLRRALDSLAAPSWWRYAAMPGRMGWVRRRAGSWPALILAATGIPRIGPGTDAEGWLIVRLTSDAEGPVLELSGVVAAGVLSASDRLLDDLRARPIARWDPTRSSPPRR